MLFESRLREFLVIARDKVTNQTLIFCRKIVHHHGTSGNSRIVRDGGFDFAEFNPVAADFHLIIDAAEEIERPILVPACQVTRAIKSIRAAFCK